MHSSFNHASPFFFLPSLPPGQVKSAPSSPVGPQSTSNRIKKAVDFPPPESTDESFKIFFSPLSTMTAHDL